MSEHPVIQESGDQPRRSIFSRTLVRLARRLKGDETFDIDAALRNSDLFGFASRRAAMAMRGTLLSLRTGHWVFPVFIGRRVTVTGAGHLHLSPGVTIDDDCRLDCAGRVGIRLGRGVTIRRGSQIEVTSVMRQLGEGAILADRVGISEGCFIGAKGPVTIGEGTIVGPGTRILAENHVFESRNSPIQSQGVTRKGVSIGSDCWLGAAVTVLDGVTVGDGCVIGAAALVNRDVAPFTIAVGVPARPVRER